MNGAPQPIAPFGQETTRVLHLLGKAYAVLAAEAEGLGVGYDAWAQALAPEDQAILARCDEIAAAAYQDLVAQLKARRGH